MHSKLLGESALSLILGMATAGLYPYYYKRIYATNICTIYDDLKLAIRLNPALAKPDDDTAINKNFGPSKWNSKESDMEDDETIELSNEIGIFDGHADDEGKYQRSRVLEMV